MLWDHLDAVEFAQWLGVKVDELKDMPARELTRRTILRIHQNDPHRARIAVRTFDDKPRATSLPKGS